MIQIQDLNMLKTITPLTHNLFIHYSSDQYYLNIIYTKQPKFRIASEEKIAYFSVLHSLQSSYMQKNTTIDYYYIIVVDVTMSWAIYCIKSLQSQQPVLIHKGKFISEKHELKKLVGIHEMDHKLVLVFDKFILYYIYLPKDLKKINHPLMNKEFIPYGSEPQFLHEPFSINKGFLPQQEQLDLSFSYYQNISQDKGIMLLAVQSKANKLNSIYSVEYDRKKCYLMSGRSIFLNIENKILSILSTSKPDTFIIQTQGKLLVWNINFNEGQSNYQTYEYNLSLLNKYISKSEIIYIALEYNKPNLITLSNKQNALVKSSVSLTIPSQLSCQQIYASQKQDDFYILTQKGQFYFIRRQGAFKVIQNSFTSIVKSHLNISDTYNFLIVEKKIGNQSNKILLGNHLFAYSTEHFAHGLLLSASNLISINGDTETCSLYLTSPLIGLLKLDINRTKNKPIKQKNKKAIKDQNQLFEFSIDKNIKANNEQTYFLNDHYQITQQEVIEIGKKPTKVTKLFENAISFIERALVLSNQLVVLIIFEQVHVFDNKLMRKYIHCFNSQIKNIYPLNNINVIAVQLYEPTQKSNMLHILVLQQQKATKMKTISVPDVFSHLQLTTTINTSEYKLNIFGNQLVICSNDALHKYQPEKIVVQSFDLPLPQSSSTRYEVIPIANFSKDKNTSEFLLIFRQLQLQMQDTFSRVQVYFCTFLQKYLFKKLQLKNLYLNIQKIMTLTQLPKDIPLLAVTYNFNEGLNKNLSSYRYLLLLGQKNVSICCMKFGKIQLQYLANSTYLTKQLQKIETISEKIVKASNSLAIEKPISLIKTKKSDYFLVYNQRQIYYANYQIDKINTISYYSLINDEFVTFRNNLHINQLNDEHFMSIFSQKMMIKDIKYVSDSIIFVLYEYCIVVLEIGSNNSLVVKQQIKFRNAESTQVIKIEEFLQNYDEESIYLRESHGRIYLLKKVDKIYEIVFHSYMDQEVILFTRINNWFNRHRVLRLQKLLEEKSYQELVLKKDGQLLIKSEQTKQEENKLVYV